MTAQNPNEGGQRLQNFPVTFFAVVMGLSGITLAFHAGAVEYPVLEQANVVSLWITTLAFGLISLVYAVKAAKHFSHVKAEWQHPVRLAFFPAISISALLVILAWLGHVGDAVRPFFFVAAGMQIVLTLAVISGWIGHRAFQHGQLSPAWFIPAVGNVLVPLIGIPLGYVDLSWFFFSFGMIFWIILLTLVVNRLVFHDPLPGKLQPTLVILIAPPAIGFVAWIALVGFDPFARVLANVAFVFALIVSVQIPKLVKLPFAMSFWALSFPLAALTIASFRYGAATQTALFTFLGTALLFLLTGVIVGLILRTLRAAHAGKICVPE